MDKRYDQATLQALGAGQDRVEQGATITYKPLPGTDDPGGVDPGILKGAKKMAFMMKLMPKKRREAMFGDLAAMRKMFNGIKSIPVTREDMKIARLAVPGPGGDIPLRIYLPRGEAKALPVLYYIHGGGWFAGSPDVVEQACKMIADMHPCIAVSVDYRLAPEHPFPAGHEDCWAALGWVRDHIGEYGGDPGRIAVSGDSAGGNMCICCALRDRDEGTGMVKACIPLYPAVNAANGEDRFYKRPTMDMFDLDDKYKKYVNPLMMGDMLGSVGGFMGVSDPANPLMSPYLTDLTGMPPTLILVGGHDYLMPSCKAFAAKLTQAGVPVRTVIYRGIGHAFLDEVGIKPQAEDALMEASRFMSQYMG